MKHTSSVNMAPPRRGKIKAAIFRCMGHSITLYYGSLRRKIGGGFFFWSLVKPLFCENLAGKNHAVRSAIEIASLHEWVTKLAFFFLFLAAQRKLLL
ncbi:hypothetical protein SUGI_0187560 [Cryptomeria japonica]|nr:hypothetical protein SUGI_0187560 [Cryptomeria japonica]